MESIIEPLSHVVCPECGAFGFKTGRIERTDLFLLLHGLDDWDPCMPSPSLLVYLPTFLHDQLRETVRISPGLIMRDWDAMANVYLVLQLNPFHFRTVPR